MTRNLFFIQRRTEPLNMLSSCQADPALKKVDEAFWEKFQAVSSGREMDVLTCYRK